jgi:hypothetical protein
MSTQDAPDQLIAHLIHGRAKAYAGALEKFEAQKARQAKSNEAFGKGQIKYLSSIGVKVNELKREQAKEAQALAAYLAEVRPPFLARPGFQADDGKDRALLATRFPAGAVWVPPYGVFAPPGQGSSAITSGWVFSDASYLRIKDQVTGSGWTPAWDAVAVPPPIPHDVLFTFIPAETGSYNLNAVFAFHGFYVLKANSGFLENAFAEVSIDLQLGAYQYVDQWQSFPSPLDISKSNTDEFDSYDRTLFFDSTVPLRQGDPVVVTARIAIQAVANDGGSYAEINFFDGSANYIQPLFLCVTLQA